MANHCERLRTAANRCEWRRTAANGGERLRTTANGGERSRTAAKARERLFAVRFVKLRMARIVNYSKNRLRLRLCNRLVIDWESITFSIKLKKLE